MLIFSGSILKDLSLINAYFVCRYNGNKQHINLYIAIDPWECKLSGTNFLDWSRNLRIVLKQERKSYILDIAFPPVPPSNAPRAQKDAYENYLNDPADVTCLMLATMVPYLQKYSKLWKHLTWWGISRKCSKSKPVKKGSWQWRHWMSVRWLMGLRWVHTFSRWKVVLINLRDLVLL